MSARKQTARTRVHRTPFLIIEPSFLKSSRRYPDGGVATGHRVGVATVRKRSHWRQRPRGRYLPGGKGLDAQHAQTPKEQQRRQKHPQNDHEIISSLVTMYIQT